MKKWSQRSTGTSIAKMPFLCAMFSLLVFMTACANTKKVVIDTSNETNWMFTDSVWAKQIDDSLKQVLFAPDTVNCYHISYKEKIKEKDIEVVKDYVRDSLITKLNSSQISVMQYVLISNPANYANDTILVQSPYFPTLEFEFAKKDYNSISIVISILDRSWRMMSMGKEIHVHNIAEVKQLERFCNYFMDIYERKEEKK